MKLKLKLSLLFSAIAIMLVIAISLFLRFIVVDHLMTHIEETRSDYRRYDQQIARELQARYPQRQKMASYLKATALTHHMQLTLYTQNLKPALIYDDSQTRNMPIEEWYPIRNHHGQIGFFLNIHRQIQWRELAFTTIFSWTLPFLIVLLGMLFVLLFIYLNRLITQPVQQLNHLIREINLSGPLLSMHRLDRQDEIGELYAHVSALQQRLHQTRNEQITMISAITHDVKTPLTSINGFIELLQTQAGLTSQSKKDYLQLIDKKAKDITQLMTALSSYAKDELVLPSMSLSRLNANHFFNQMAEEYEAELSGLGMQLIKNNGLPPDCFLLGDRALLGRVFANTISNAVKYGEKNNLSLFLTGYVKRKQILFVIEDDGIGVPNKSLPFIFHRFFTVDQSRQSKVGGTGLGLATVQSIIEKHGGQINAFHSTHGGLGVQFSIPEVD